MVLLLGLAIPALAAAEEPATVAGAERVLLRRGPGTEFQAFDTLKRGQRVHVEEVTGVWALVQTEAGQHGYMHGFYLQQADGTRVASAPPPTATAAPGAGRVAAGLDMTALALPPGEATKGWPPFERAVEWLLAQRVERRDVVVALGGGVIGDLGGFAAAVLRRGVRFVQIPTSLLAQVDSSVGGKTAVNHPKGKNIIGAFYQPRAVFIDTAALRTLPEREFVSGMAEVVKYGAIRDRDFFYYLKNNLGAIKSLKQDVMTHIIKTSCAIKAEVVSRDEREAGLRAILNFGHTVGHAVESLLGYGKLKHGECVSIGMACAGRISVELGLCPQEEAAELVSLLQATGLPVKLPEIDPRDILTAMSLDKKVRQGKMRLVVMEGLGKVVIKEDVDNELLLRCLSG